MKRLKYVIFFILLSFYSILSQAEVYEGVTLKAPIDPSSVPSLQRGAKMYINYCSSCHSLNFMRYNRLARDLHVDEALAKTSFIFTGAKITDTIRVAMQTNEAKTWFGVAPPDLSVVARARGVDWLYTYLLSFYQDKNRPLGVNNLVFNETAMPDVLVNLRGVQVPVYTTKKINLGNEVQTVRAIDHLVLIKHGSMTPDQFDTAVADLVNFLAYVAEPNKQQRMHIGVWVLIYLIIFAILAYLLKQVFWKNVK